MPSQGRSLFDVLIAHTKTPSLRAIRPHRLRDTLSRHTCSYLLVRTLDYHSIPSRASFRRLFSAFDCFISFLACAFSIHIPFEVAFHSTLTLRALASMAFMPAFT